MFSTTNWLKNNKVAVCLYLYHTDLWPEFKQLLLPLRKYIKLYVGLCTDKPLIDDFQDFDHCVTVHDNYGADVAPFLHQLSIVDEPVFIKLHSKKSLWGFKKHIHWRYILLHDLVSSVSIFRDNIKILMSHHEHAVLCNPILLLNNKEITNTTKIQELCKIIAVDYNLVKNSKFIAGNMFMGKTKIYQKYFNKSFNQIDKLLKLEIGKVSDSKHGTYSHSMERLFGYIVPYNNSIFCHTKYNTIKILNNEAPNKKYFNLIKIYNNYCYLLEDPNVYGYFDVLKNTITWLHLEQPTEQRYKILSSSTIKKI